MKQGVLITAYKNFKHLCDIADAFDDDFKIYIHIDKKVSVQDSIITLLKAKENVVLVSQKFTVNWGGYNHLKAILYLAKEALIDDKIKYFHFITGHDYPIKSCAEFKSFFTEHQHKDFIDIVSLPYEKWREGGFYRLKYYHLYDVLNAKKYRPYIFKLIEFQKKLKITRSRSKLPKNLYGGETYWSLSRETLSYLINYTERNPKFYKRMRFTFCSEEIYIHSVIMNSHLAYKVTSDSLRFIHWEKRNGNFPANLDLQDGTAIKKSNAFFARRFEFPVSQPLKDYVKNNLTT